MIDLVPLKFEDGRLTILDQTRLPNEEVWIELKCKEDVWQAIKELQVRGAPAIGVCAAYGLYVSVRDFCPKSAPGMGEGAGCGARKAFLINYIKEKK